ncbi:MAG: hypothetical protein JNJ83_18370 [Verrucomicrobiaceae bacterium]|nr:hypothetical protein [Verrucomicrobiaceae bacterium]
MALIGAIWALFGLIAVIPSVLFTKMVDLAEGRPSSLVYEQPPVAFTVFMGVLLFIGMGAPIGTTILGAISMGNIKKSGGKLYGLPLAFADTVFFPMLLLHGAMSVMLGLLIVTIMKIADVNAGLGITEMGLLAMLPLIADFFIVRALWRKMAGGAMGDSVAGSATPARTTPLDHRISEAFTKGFPAWYLRRALWLRQTIYGTLVLAAFSILYSPSIWTLILAIAAMMLVDRLDRAEREQRGPGKPMAAMVRWGIGLVLGLLLLACVVCLLSFTMKNADGISSIRVGVPSPWFIAETGPEGLHMGLHPTASSVTFLVMGVILVLILQRLGGTMDGEDSAAQESRRSMRRWFVALLVLIFVFVCGVAAFVVMSEPLRGHFQQVSHGSARIVAEEMGAQEPEQYRIRYQIHTPPDHRVLVWMETTRNGKPVVIPGLANNISTSTQLSIGERFDGDAEFSLVEGSRITPESKGKWRWDFKHGTVGKNTHRISPGGWIDNPFAGMSTSVHQGPKSWEPKPGEEVSILVIRGGSHSYSSDPAAEAPAGDIELRLKARIDAVPLFHRVQGSVGSSLRDPFPTPATPLGSIAAGFRVDPKLPEDEIRRQMIAELTNNDSKRLNAEMILKSVGKPVTHETKPEDVLKALESVAETVK